MALQDETEALMDDVIDTLRTQDYETPANILLLGTTGAGKSALINTVHKAITGRYYNIAIQGKGNGHSVTLDLTRYWNCGVSVNRVLDEKRRDRLESVVSNLPHLWDCAGLGNENTPELQELLELIIGGYIRPGTSIEALEDMQRENGVGSLKQILEDPNPSWKMSKIVFLVACTEMIPKNLIECLNTILRKYDRRTLIRKYQCDVYVVITMYDFVQDSTETNLHGTNMEKAIKYEDFQSIEDEIASEFSFGGAFRSHSFRWVSLTDNVGYDNPEVNKKSLEFLKRLIEPGVPRIPDTTPAVKEDMRLLYRFANILGVVFVQLLNTIRENYDNPLIILLIITFVVLVFSFVYILLNAAI